MSHPALSPAVRAAAGFLIRCQQPDGGWGYHLGNRTSFVEPTAWALTALVDSPVPGEAKIDETVAFLLANQNPDGGWANVPGMPSDMMTARVVFALTGRAGCESAVARGAEWLKRNELAKGGWGWCYGTTGFLETAAYAIVALSAVGRLNAPDRFTDYITGLRCSDGGWCSHVPKKVGFVQRSQMSVTPLGIIALCRLGLRPGSDTGLKEAVDLITGWIERGRVTTAYSLALMLWALREADGSGPTAATAAELALARVGDDGGWNANVLQTAIMCRGLAWLAST